MILTAISISIIPVIVLKLKCSSRNIPPSITAVRGCNAPIMEVSVGPTLLIAFTPVKLDTIVDHNPSPRM